MPTFPQSADVRSSGTCSCWGGSSSGSGSGCSSTTWSPSWASRVSSSKMPPKRSPARSGMSPTPWAMLPCSVTPWPLHSMGPSRPYRDRRCRPVTAGGGDSSRPMGWCGRRRPPHRPRSGPMAPWPPALDPGFPGGERTPRRHGAVRHAGARQPSDPRTRRDRPDTRFSGTGRRRPCHRGAGRTLELGALGVLDRRVSPGRAPSSDREPIPSDRPNEAESRLVPWHSPGPRKVSPLVSSSLTSSPKNSPHSFLGEITIPLPLPLHSLSHSGEYCPPPTHFSQVVLQSLPLPRRYTPPYRPLPQISFSLSPSLRLLGSWGVALSGGRSEGVPPLAGSAALPPSLATCPPRPPVGRPPPPPQGPPLPGAPPGAKDAVSPSPLPISFVARWLSGSGSPPLPPPTGCPPPFGFAPPRWAPPPSRPPPGPLWCGGVLASGLCLLGAGAVLPSSPLSPAPPPEKVGRRAPPPSRPAISLHPLRPTR